MEKTIKIINGFDNILKVIQEFSQCFYTLKTGKVNTLQIAEKLSKKGIVLGLSVNGKILGFAAFYANDFTDKTAYLSLFAVASQYRKMGYGKALIDEVVSKSRNAGMDKIILQVLNKNTGAISFYQKIGFNITRNIEETCFMEKMI